MTIDNDPMTTYLKSLASLPVLLVTGVWREGATRARTRRLLAGVQGVIMAAGVMATEGVTRWTLDTRAGKKRPFANFEVSQSQRRPLPYQGYYTFKNLI